MNQLSGEISKGIGAEATQDKALGRVLKLGLDVHYRQVTVAMQEDGGRIKAAGKMGLGGFSELGPDEVGTRLADRELLRSRSQWLLVTSSTGRTGSQKPGGGAQGDGGS